MIVSFSLSIASWIWFYSYFFPYTLREITNIFANYWDYIWWVLIARGSGVFKGGGTEENIKLYIWWEERENSYTHIVYFRLSVKQLFRIDWVCLGKYLQWSLWARNGRLFSWWPRWHPGYYRSYSSQSWFVFQLHKWYRSVGISFLLWAHKFFFLSP